jgi:hypothetical protein
VYGWMRFVPESHLCQLDLYGLEKVGFITIFFFWVLGGDPTIVA